MQSIVLRPGRKPLEQFRKSLSQIGSSTIFTSICTTRSLRVAIPSGRIFPLRLNGGECFLGHPVNSRGFGSLIGEHQGQCFEYPLFSADETVQVVELVSWIVLCL